jgi:hypothetical protein
VSDPEAKFCVSCGAPLDSAPIPDANAPARGLNNMLAQIDGEVSQALSDLSQSIGGAAGSAPSLSFGSERVEIPQAGSLEPIANADIASGTNEMTVENPVKYQDIYSPEEEEPKGAEEGAPDASAPGAQIEAALGDAPGAIIYMPTMSTAIGDGIASAGEDNGIILTWPQKAEAAIITEDAEPRPLHGSAPAAPRIFDGPQAPWTDITPTARRAAPPEPAAAPAAGDAGGEWFDILSLKTPDGQTLSDTVQESSQSRVEPVTEWFDECGPEEPEPPSAEGEGESLPAPAPRLSMDAKQSSRITPILSLDDSVPDHMETLEDWDSGEVDEAVADVAELDFAESGEDSLGDDAFFPTDSIASLAALDSPEKASEAPEYEMSSKDDEIVARLEDVEQEACPSCNAKRKKGAKFCTKCGYRFV